MRKNEVQRSPREKPGACKVSRVRLTAFHVRSQDKNKPKTEAQTRYAKKKKEKAKKMKQAAIRAAPKAKPTPPTTAAAIDVPAVEEDDVAVAKAMRKRKHKEERALKSAYDSVEDGIVEEKEKDVERARKRRKSTPPPSPAQDANGTSTSTSRLGTAPSGDEKDDDDNSDGVDDDDVTMLSQSSRPDSPKLESLGLEPFPTPGPAHAPASAELLHPMTVPHALTTATIIFSSHVSPLPSASSSAPSSSISAATNLTDRTLSRLENLGITELFAVQTGVIPFLLPSLSSSEGLSTGLYPMQAPRDICVSAPTGSGKTLSYAVPVAQILSTRIVTRLRALIILPTRDLVAQVKDTFDALAKGSGLKIAAVTGAQSFSTEQAHLVGPLDANGAPGSTLVDILICTPGRLIDHLNGTPGFTLEHLRFLVGHLSI